MIAEDACRSAASAPLTQPMTRRPPHRFLQVPVVPVLVCFQPGRFSCESRLLPVPGLVPNDLPRGLSTQY